MSKACVEARRLSALYGYPLLDTPAEGDFDDLTALAAQICQTPVAAISLVDQDRQWFKSLQGLGLRQIAREGSFCDIAIQQSGLLIVPDALSDERFAACSLLAGPQPIRFYAGAPLLDRQGLALGTLCVMDHVPRELTSPQQTALRTLSHQVMAQLELRRNSSELDESRKLLRLATEKARVGLIIVTADRRYAYANQTYSEIMGLTGVPLVGRLVEDVLKEVFDSQIRPRLDRAFAGERVAYELHREGRVYAARLEPTESNCVVVVITDVSENRQAEERARLDQERFQMVARATQDAVRDWDSSTTTMWWNNSFQTRFGYHPEEFPRSWEAWAEYLHTSDRPRVLAGLSRAMEGNASVWWDEYRFRRRDGSYAEILDRCSIVRGPDGQVKRMAGTMQDVSALRQAEERMSFTLESSGIGIWDMDYRTGQLNWSEGLEAQYGLEPGSFAGNLEAFLALLHSEDRAGVMQVVQNAVKAGSDFSVEHRVVRPDGTVRWLSGSGRIILDEQGRPLRGVGISKDVTERRKLQEQYLQAQKMEAVGQLAGGVAHDFNNLLTVILGFSHMLMEDPAIKEETRESLEEIHAAGITAASLTGQLLAFSRKQIVQPVVLDLNAVVGGMRAMLSRLLGEDVRISLVLSPHPLTIKADSGQLEQVVMNLAVNARDAMPNGGTLTIETASDLEGVELRVSDTGSGMTAEVQQHLFEPFFTTKEVGRGTGLGLSTVHGIVNQSGGSIQVKSQLGRGSSLLLRFPAAETVEALTPAVRATRFAAGTDTILVVDDAEGLIRFVQELLSQHGFNVLVARSAKSAMQIFVHRPDIKVLLTDVVMPDISGPELSQRMLEQRPDLKVIYMSGYSEDAIAQRGVLNPGIVFLQKPFSADSLLEKLGAVCEGGPAGLSTG